MKQHILKKAEAAIRLRELAKELNLPASKLEKWLNYRNERSK